MKPAPANAGGSLAQNPIIQILYVDDSPEFRVLVKEVLESKHSGFQVTGAANRAEFESRLAERDYDLVLTDFHMHNFRGSQVIEAVLAKHPTVPVVVFSGSGTEQSAVECLRLGAMDYVIKSPQQVRLLPQTIQAAIERRQLLDERARAAEALRASEERYRGLFENAHDLIYTHDLEGRFTSFNMTAERVTGHSRDQVLQLNFADLVTAEYVETARRMLQVKLTGGGATVYELEIMAADGRRIPLEVATTLICHQDKPVGVQGIGRDITERKRTGQELLRLAAAVEQSTESIIITGLEGDIQYVNPACARITGLPRQELNGRHFDFILQGKDVPFTFKEIIGKIAVAGFWTGRFSSVQKDNVWISEEASISPIRNASGEIINYLAINRDVTKEADLQEQVRLAQKMEAIGLLAGGVAHDFNNILQVIQGFTELAKDDNLTLEERQNYLAQVTQSAERASQLTRQLLAFGRRQPLQRVDLDLDQVVSDQLDMIRRLIGEHIEVAFVPGGDLANVRADRSQLEQVLLNLCVNARDAMPNGGQLEIQCRNLKIDDEFLEKNSWARCGRFVLLSVKDIGQGMDKETMTRIFEPFFTTKTKEKGTGLGLATVYGIIKQHDGMIHVKSEPGVGAIFSIYLPVVARGTASGKLPPAAKPKQGSESILLAEDEPQVRALALKILERAGYHVITAANGEEAVNIFKAEAGRFDLLVFDVVMPKLGGRDAHERIKLISPDMPALFCSGYSGTALQAGFELAPGVHLLQKPYTADALLNRVRELLDATKKPPAGNADQRSQV